MVDLSMAMLNNQMVISPISPLSHDHTPKFCDVHLTVFFGPVAGAAVAQHRTPGSMRPRGKFGPWTAMTATPKNWLVTILLMNPLGGLVNVLKHHPTCDIISISSFFRVFKITKKKSNKDI